MLDEINARLRDARTKRDEQRLLRGSLPRLEEDLKREAYRLQSLEACLDDVETQVRKLESASLNALVASLMGNKEAQLAERKRELADFQQQLEACAAIVADLSQQIEQAQGDLDGADDAGAAYDALLEQKQTMIQDAGDEQAARLKDVLEQLDCAAGYRNGVDRTIHSCEHVTERIHSLTRSVGRARTKGINARAGGALLAVAVNTAMQGGTAKPAVKRVVEGLEALHADINKLEWRGDHPRDERVLELSSAVAGFATDVQSRGAMEMIWDSSCTGPMLDAVQELSGHLKDVSAEMTEQINSLEAERNAIVEHA